MKTINQETITQEVKRLCQEANYVLPQDVYQALKEAYETEDSLLSKQTLEVLHKNAQIARETCSPICQDTGMAIIFMEIGQDVHIVGGLLQNAVNEGVRKGYEKGYLRKSVVKDPFLRVNTNDNTPAILYTNIVEGDKIDITVAPKGFGSENMSRVYMLKPSDGIEGAKKAILETVEQAGPNPCPPMMVGVGCGGSFEYSAYLAKKALLRPIGSHSDKKHIRDMEEELLQKMNNMGIGPQGLGGNTTVLAVNIESYATHIAGMPIAINISCHVTRHCHEII